MLVLLVKGVVVEVRLYNENVTPHILLIDDTKENLEILSRILTSEGYQVSRVSSGQEALQKVCTLQPDLILLDIMMPELDGIATCKGIKKIEDCQSIPIIFMTSNQDIDVLSQAFEVGGVDYITKPAFKQEIIGRVNTHLLIHKQHVLLEQKIKEVNEANQLKDKFVSLVAHDLRSPYNSLLNGLEILLTDDKNPVDKEHKILLNKLLAMGKRQLTMINEILDIGRLQSGAIKIKPNYINLHYFISDIITAHGTLLMKKKISILNSISPDMRVYADRILLYEVLYNLVHNAFKFSQENKSIHIFAIEEEMLKISVRDHGVGIDEDILPNLFNIEKKTTTTGTFGEKGTGFGLPYSHEIIKAHGGKMTAENISGGSCFTLHLPIITPELLIVDDEIEFRQWVNALINHSMPDVNLTLAEDAAQALTMIANKHFDLVLTDIIMPEMSGLELLKEIKKDDRNKSLPVILMTAMDPSNLNERYFHLGAEDFISKPVSSADLVTRIRHFIG